MLDSLIRFSIRNPFLIGLLTLGLVAWGGYSVAHLPIDAVPDITNNQVQIITQSPALGAGDVERLVTFPIEQAVATVPGIEQVRSFSRFGLSIVTVVFTDETDLYWARQQISERLPAAQGQMPPTAGRPALAPVTTGLGEIYQYTLRVKKGYEHRYPATELRTMQDWIIRRRLLGTPGVADVSSFGGYEKQYEIALDPDRLRSYGLTMAQVLAALEAGNGNTGGAYIDKTPVAYFIRTEGLAATPDDLGAMVAQPATAARPVPVLVRDLATVRPGHAVRYGLMTRNDEGEAVGGLVLMLKGANSSEVVARVKARVAEIEKSLPPGIVIEPFLDRTKLVNHAISTVQKNLAEGALIVVFVLVLFLGNLRAGLVVASVIPLSMLFAVAMMRVFGVSGNLLSLGAIDFGLIVDGTVIIVEAIAHRLAVKGTSGLLTRAEMNEEVFAASSKIRPMSFFGELIILIVYLPLLALGGIEGKMFHPMAQTVAFAIIGASILSLTYVPMMAALVMSRQAGPSPTLADRALGWLGVRYRRLVGWALGAKAVVLGVAMLLMAGAVAVFGGLGGEFLPTLEEGDFAVETRVLPGSSILYTAQKAQQAAGILRRDFPEVVEVVGKVGSSEIPTDPMPAEQCDLIVVLKDQSTWTTAGSREALADSMARHLRMLAGVTFGFQQPIQMRFNELISGARQDVVIKVFGEDLAQLDDYARQIGQAVRGLPGVADLYVERAGGQQQIVARIRRDRLAAYGLTVDDVNRTVRAAFAGQPAGQVYEQERRFEVVVRLDSASRQDIANVRQLYIAAPDGRQVPLDQLADVAYETGPSQIQRDDAHRRVVVGFNVRGRDVETVVAEAQRRLARQVPLAPGYYLTYGGQFENLRSATERLKVAVPLALGLIFLLLYVPFGSVMQAALIFSAIPLSAVGGVAALWLRGMPFSISAGVGFIALFGVAVLNGIVLIGYLNQLKAEGWTDLRARILEGTQVRLRPVLMTATVASLGFLPMALSGSAGAEVQKPLATVVIGGLVSATLLTLLVLPVLYYLSEVRGQRSEARGRGAEGIGRGWLKKALCLAFLSIVHCQLSIPASGQRPAALTATQAVTAALASNGTVQLASRQLEAQQAGVGAARDVGRTSVQAMYGQYNSINLDNQFTITQPFAWPSYYRAQAGLARAQAATAGHRLALARAEVRRQVRLQYEAAVHARHRLRLLGVQDSAYAWFLHAAEAHRRAGEAARLEPATAAVQLGETRGLASQARADYITALRHLQTLMQQAKTPVLADTTLTPLMPAGGEPLPDSARLARTLATRLAAQQLSVSQAETRTTMAQNKPGFALGYFNQSLIGPQTVRGQERVFGAGYRFQGVQATVALPLYQKPQRARVQQARIGEQAALDAAARAQAEQAGRLDELLAQRAAQRERLRFYEETGLPQAGLIVRLAVKGFAAGETAFAEYLLHLERAFRLRTDYLDVLLAHNQTVIELDYLLTETD